MGPARVAEWEAGRIDPWRWNPFRAFQHTLESTLSFSYPVLLYMPRWKGKRWKNRFALSGDFPIRMMMI